MRKITFAILFLVFIPVISFGETECTDRPECWPEGSAMHTGLLLAKKQNAIEKLMASEQEKLVKLVSDASSSDGELHTDGRLVRALKAQQSAWITYRANECELIGSLTGAGGTWPSTYAIRCEVNLSQQRLRRIRSATQCIEKISIEKRIFEQNTCLQQLAPLVNK
ncbi:MAG: lysozyme inhibitor LprI family protein [Collimonas sp.]|uniref:lysozyme inhibitor LprI family protein n=1 Tax=Collimonas sp. TaxID=1963772 RepID=UPI003267360C